MIRPVTDLHFYHIPKTAGTSLAGMIRRAYAPGDGIPAYSVAGLAKLPPEEIPRYKCYTGHFYSVLENCVGRELPTVTLLRNPFAHSLSLIKYIRRDLDIHWLLRKLFASGLMVWEGVPFSRKLIESKVCPLLLNNFQTRALGCDLAPLEEFRRKPYFLSAIVYHLRNSDMEGCFARAVARLEKMAVVGTVERFEESAGLIFDLLGVPLPAQIPHDNASARVGGPGPRSAEVTVSADLAGLIESQTVYDRQLYRLACQRLEAALERKKAARPPSLS